MNNLYESIKTKLTESNMPYGFRDYTEEDIGYSEVNSHGYDLLKGVRDYFKMELDMAKSDPFVFQGLEKPEAMEQAIKHIDEAIKQLDICWDMDEDDKPVQ